MKHRIVHILQKYLFNPPVKFLFAIGVAPPGRALLDRRRAWPERSVRSQYYGQSSRALEAPSWPASALAHRYRLLAS